MHRVPRSEAPLVSRSAPGRAPALRIAGSPTRQLEPARDARLRHPLAPNMFIIGASKAGSSALHAYLALHPQIRMSSEKEPCFFVDQAQLEAAWPIMARQPWSHDPQAYLALWQGAESATYRGEGSVYYAQAPHRTGVAARIAAACPNARIIYTVREPVGRAVAHYWQRYKEFQERLPIAAAMERNAIYRDTSDYALQLGEYLDHFEPGQIHVIVAEELRAQRRAVLDRCLDWLGLPLCTFSDEDLAERHRSPPTARRQRYPFVSRIRDSAIWATARKRLPRAWITRLREASTVTFDKVLVDESVARAYLSNYLEPRRAAFEAMIGRRITAWDMA